MNKHLETKKSLKTLLSSGRVEVSLHVGRNKVKPTFWSWQMMFEAFLMTRLFQSTGIHFFLSLFSSFILCHVESKCFNPEPHDLNQNLTGVQKLKRSRKTGLTLCYRTLFSFSRNDHFSKENKKAVKRYTTFVTNRINIIINMFLNFKQ